MLIDPAVLAAQLSRELPGWKAHRLMDVRPQGYRQVPSMAQHAAVGVILFPEEHETQVLYVKRTSAGGPQPHRGQIGFPGGKQEPADQTLWHTAIREIAEETGIFVEEKQLMGALTPLYIPVSNFLVHPYVIYLEKVPEIIVQPSEIQRVIYAPWTYLVDPERIRRQDIPVGQELILENVPYYDLYDEVLWGATAMITAELLYLLNSP